MTPEHFYRNQTEQRSFPRESEAASIESLEYLPEVLQMLLQGMAIDDDVVDITPREPLATLLS